MQPKHRDKIRATLAGGSPTQRPLLNRLANSLLCTCAAAAQCSVCACSALCMTPAVAAPHLCFLWCAALQHQLVCTSLLGWLVHKLYPNNVVLTDCMHTAPVIISKHALVHATAGRFSQHQVFAPWILEQKLPAALPSTAMVAGAH